MYLLAPCKVLKTLIKIEKLAFCFLLSALSF